LNYASGCHIVDHLTQGGLYLGSFCRGKPQLRIARVSFTVKGDLIILLHGFIKKSGKTPLDDLSLARQRLAQLRGEQ
jgi:hypothetical protein